MPRSRPARRALKWGLPLGGVLLAAYVAVAYLIASGVTAAERKALEDHPTAYGLQYEDVSFPSREGDVALKGWYMPSGRDGPALVFVHGITGSRTSDGAVDLASRLVARGYAVLLFDLRGHGESGGERVTGGYLERFDVLGALDYLATREVPPERIGLLGLSMGAGTAVLAAAEAPRVRALVLDSTYAEVSDLIAQETARKTVFPEWLVPVFVPGAALLADLLYGIELSAMVPEEAVARLDYPILVVHGTADSRIPFRHGERVQQAAPPGSELWPVEGSDHVDAFTDHPDEYVERVVRYFDGRLRPQ